MFVMINHYRGLLLLYINLYNILIYYIIDLTECVTLIYWYDGVHTERHSRFPDLRRSVFQSPSIESATISN